MTTNERKEKKTLKKNLKKENYSRNVIVRERIKFVLHNAENQARIVQLNNEKKK